MHQALGRRNKVIPFINDIISDQYQLKSPTEVKQLCKFSHFLGNVGIGDHFRTIVMTVNHTKKDYNCSAMPVMPHLVICVATYCLFIVKCLIKTASIHDH